MKQIIAVIILIFVLSPVIAQKAKVSPQVRLYMQQVKKAGRNEAIDGYVYRVGENNAVYLCGMIKAGSVQEQALSSLGVKVGTKAGDIWTVQIPLASVDAFINVNGIEYIEFDQPIFSNNDSARVTTRVDSVHAGINMPMPYTGKNVVVGLIDAGFDYTHVTLFDTTGNNYRVKKIWEQKKPGVPPSQFFYGNELVTAAAMFMAKTDANGFSHGTHVAGIAGGSGFGSDANNSRFRGMAYESDLVLVGITPTVYSWTSTGLSEIVDAISYIFSYAAVNGKPAVANLSWGCCIGPHDGSSLFSQACDNLTGPGKIFVCSGGNNGQTKVHFNKTFSVSDTLINTVLELPDVQGQKKTWVDAWGDTAQSFCLEAALYSSGGSFLQTVGSYCSNSVSSGVYDLYMIGTNNDTCFISITTDSATYNNKPRIFLDVYNKTTDDIVLTLKGTSGTVDMWTGYVKNKTGYYGYFDQAVVLSPSIGGNTDATISDISATRSAIAVAAYSSKNTFQNILGNNVSYTGYVNNGNIAPFSSKGPTADGRVKPDIAGPGLILGSGVSSYDTSFALTTGTNYPAVVTSYYKQQNNRTYQYGMLMGTSMSSPAAAGIIALMLQVDATLDPDEVKDILKQTAILDNFTGTIPSQGSNIWGHGKINAYGAVMYLVSQQLGIETVSATGEQLPYMLYPNPNTGNYSIDYSTGKDEVLKLEVYSITGSSIISKEWQVKAGGNTTVIDLQRVPAGVYFTKISSKTGSAVIKMVIE
jgi:minor extracellular serine protease Vpr